MVTGPGPPAASIVSLGAKLSGNDQLTGLAAGRHHRQSAIRIFLDQPDTAHVATGVSLDIVGIEIRRVGRSEANLPVPVYAKFVYCLKPHLPVAAQSGQHRLCGGNRRNSE